MDRKHRRLAHLLSKGGRKDLMWLDREEALFQYMNTLLNPRTPLKLNDCRARWVKALHLRYTSDTPPVLDIACFTFGLRHFNLELIETLMDDIPSRVLFIIQQTVASIFQTSKASTSQDHLSILKLLPWGDVAQFVSQFNWDLAWKFIHGGTSLNVYFETETI